MRTFTWFRIIYSSELWETALACSQLSEVQDFLKSRSCCSVMLIMLKKLNKLMQIFISQK